ncbi:family 43 glycosylhydrolase [Parvularcula dongshanensis]|uniref:Xylan 1,4-beta-xylosidase n=1 Tax=Parvularcula dongshanensis TaxID=1173995 RepID=A0A840I359_9PROT|nr:family 43 glycosylhydrolase [Parvularcula dongshanensis]MBB4658732.1 xylan 1,4-beta-xylosidase [Parvularcula dongshanensis]
MGTRRDLMKSLTLGAGATALSGAKAAPCGGGEPAAWRRGVEGQRVPDLGDGRFLNPILSGDHADPTVLKDGDAYYMTFSSFDTVPGIVIWQSRDLVNWSPVATALKTAVGSVWALDLVKHDGRYFIYIPVVGDAGQTIMVIHADRIEGPWSEPIDLGIPDRIDPGHAVGEDGKRYLFVNGGGRVRLTDDGLATDGEIEQAYELWQYPDDWIVEMYSGEGPKITRRGGYFYLVAAIGGTSGPPTGHMVVASRSRSIHGPWEQCPHNPIVRTTDPDERWLSRGHATLVEGPDGDWWMVYHGYENGFMTLGRQTLLDPVEWTEDGWFRALGGDLAQPIRKPLPASEPGRGQALSDDFTTDRFGLQWSVCEPGPNEATRARYEDAALVLRAEGTGPQDCSPVACIAGDQAYEASVTIAPRGGAIGGIVLFYSGRGFVGFGFDGSQIYTYNYSQEHSWLRIPVRSDTLRLKLENDRHIVTMSYSADGKTWTRHPWRYEVSGYHQNVFGDFRSLRPAIFSAGEGEVEYTDFTYRALT